MSIPSGISMMLKGLGIDPQEILNKVDGFAQIMASIHAALIKNQNDLALIKQRLGITDDAGGDGQIAEKPAQLSNGQTGADGGGPSKGH
jgi:hypothetical protein